eukprot:16162140-Heterocapsa_arctica.AAC.1
MDKSYSEYASCVEKNRIMFQNYIDQQEDRYRQVAKAEDDREKQRAIKVVTRDEFQELERKDFQHEVSQQIKKPRTEEPVHEKVTNCSLLTMLHKRKADQDHYRSSQSYKKVKTEKKAEQ